MQLPCFKSSSFVWSYQIFYCLCAIQLNNSLKTWRWGGGKGLSLMTFWNSEKLLNFKAHKLSWTVNELCIRIVRVSSLCPPIAHSSYSPPKFILLQFLAPKCNTRDKKREKNTHTQATRQRKLEIPCYNIQL